MTMEKNKPIKVEWKCPDCAAEPNEHGKGGRDRCIDRHSSEAACAGFLCECDGETNPGHGESFADVCVSAICYHCGWTGTYPKPPMGIQAWERKALEAGWTPPADRAKELKKTS